MRTGFLWLGAFVAGLATTATAQLPHVIRGTITDSADGAPIANAIVRLVPGTGWSLAPAGLALQELFSSQPELVARSRRDGRWSIAIPFDLIALGPGVGLTIDLTVTAPGFHRVVDRVIGATRGDARLGDLQDRNVSMRGIRRNERVAVRVEGAPEGTVVDAGLSAWNPSQREFFEVGADGLVEVILPRPLTSSMSRALLSIARHEPRRANEFGMRGQRMPFAHDGIALAPYRYVFLARSPGYFSAHTSAPWPAVGAPDQVTLTCEPWPGSESLKADWPSSHAADPATTPVRAVYTYKYGRTAVVCAPAAQLQHSTSTPIVAAWAQGMTGELIVNGQVWFLRLPKAMRSKAEDQPPWTLRIASASGEPVAGASVELFGVEAAGWMNEVEIPITARPETSMRSDSKGQITLGPRGDEPVVLRVRAAEHVTQFVFDPHLLAASESPVVRLQSAPVRNALVRVLDEDDQPVHGAWILQLTKTLRNVAGSALARTDEHGEAQCHFSESDIALHVIHPDFVFGSLSDTEVRNKREEPLIIRLQRRNPTSWSVLNPDGTPAIDLPLVQVGHAYLPVFSTDHEGRVIVDSEAAITESHWQRPQFAKVSANLKARRVTATLSIAPLLLNFRFPDDAEVLAIEWSSGFESGTYDNFDNQSNGLLLRDMESRPFMQLHFEQFSVLLAPEDLEATNVELFDLNQDLLPVRLRLVRPNGVPWKSAFEFVSLQPADLAPPNKRRFSRQPDANNHLHLRIRSDRLHELEVRSPETQPTRVVLGPATLVLDPEITVVVALRN